MEIAIKEIKKIIPYSGLEERLRQVPLMGRDEQGNQIYPYRSANISLREISVDEVNPTTFYLLQSGIEHQIRLNQELLKYGIDTLRLHSAVVFETEQGIRTLLPPIVEVQEEHVKFENHHGDRTYPGTYRIKVPLINDGAHRLYLARMREVHPTVLYLSGIPSRYPFYAFPNHWDDVRVVDEVPRNKEEKKLYRREDSYALYRNLDSVFEGCSKPRT